MKKAAGFKAGNGAKANGIGWQEEMSPTLSSAPSGTNQAPAVCIKEVLPFDTTQVTSPQNGNNPKWGDPCQPLAAQGHPPKVIFKTWDARWNGDGETVSTLTGDHENRITDTPEEKGASEPMIRYIVRRLTPTECARLQGFPDKWGKPEQKEDFTEKEYQFWLDVRNTHAAINCKAVKDYTKEQMLTWYNKLHTDSSEYKMWGNGIALPTALYMMQGIQDALAEEEV